VGSLHGSMGSRMNRKKSNRGRSREKRRPARDLRRPLLATAMWFQLKLAIICSWEYCWACCSLNL
jgi:hypothetical protein